LKNPNPHQPEKKAVQKHFIVVDAASVVVPTEYDDAPAARKMVWV